MSETIDPYRPPSAELVEATAIPELAGRGGRLVASLIDSVLGMVVVLPAMWFGGFFEGFPNIQPLGALAQFGWGILGLTTTTAIHGWFVATRGQTVGKILVGIRMVRRDGSKLSLGRWLGLRMLPIALVGQIPVVGSFLALVNVLFIFRGDRRCLHDHLADTIVVRER
jgi:uncharacterized RDD family membrane protein YckC